MCVGREADHITLYVCVCLCWQGSRLHHAVCVSLCVCLCVCVSREADYITLYVCVSVCVWAGKQTEGESVPSGSLH